MKTLNRVWIAGALTIGTLLSGCTSEEEPAPTEETELDVIDEENEISISDSSYEQPGEQENEGRAYLEDRLGISEGFEITRLEKVDVTGDMIDDVLVLARNDYDVEFIVENGADGSLHRLRMEDLSGSDHFGFDSIDITNNGAVDILLTQAFEQDVKQRLITYKDNQQKEIPLPGGIQVQATYLDEYQLKIEGIGLNQTVDLSAHKDRLETNGTYVDGEVNDSQAISFPVQHVSFANDGDFIEVYQWSQGYYDTQADHEFIQVSSKWRWSGGGWMIVDSFLKIGNRYSDD